MGCAKNAKNKSVQQVNKYLGASTIHGLAYIGNDSGSVWLEKIFWIFVVTIQFYFAYYFIMEAVDSWEDAPTVLNVNKTASQPLICL